MAKADNLYPRLWEAESMENGPAKCAILEEIIRQADLLQNTEIAFDARMNLIDAATFSGAADKALVAFSWCLAKADKDPDCVSEDDLLWRYKWITDSLSSFPQVSKQQIEKMLEDMSARLERCGFGQYPVVMLRWKLAFAMGEKQESRKYFTKLSKMSPDELADCPACVVNQRVDYAVFLGKDEEALAAAEPILAGKLRCAEVPQLTYGTLLLPLVRLGRLEEAVQMHQRGYRQAARSANLLGTVADHITFLAVTDNLAKAIKVLEKHLGQALEMTELDARFDFLLAGLFLMERLIKVETTSLKARLPRTLPFYQEKGRYEVVDLATWLEQEATELACRFDERNGNDYFTRRLKERMAWHKLATPYPLQ